MLGLAVTAVCYIQIAYLFPHKAFDKERKWLLYITTGYSVLYIGALIWFHFIQDQQGLSSKTYGKFINPIAGLFGLITTFWAAIVYLRKAHYFRRHQSKACDTRQAVSDMHGVYVGYFGAVHLSRGTSFMGHACLHLWHVDADTG